MKNNFNTNGYEYVDLGLPSGTLWAKCNVGATKPEEYGNYFACGETDPKEEYNWKIYKYNNSDGKTVLDPEDDAATVNMGGDWHMPTKEQCEELTANTTSTWTTMNGVNGRLFKSNINGNELFIPAAGDCYNGFVYDKGSNAYVWSSSLTVEYPNFAWYLYLSPSIMSIYGSIRCFGHSVRGVIG